MTLTQFVVKQSFRNKRRTAMTIISIGVSLLLLTLMMTVWRAFYIDQGAPETALRLMTRHRVSLAFFLPGSYRNKIRSVPGVVNVVPMSWFGGQYKDDKPENFFAQFGTDPEEAVKVYGEWHLRRSRSKRGYAIARVRWSGENWPRNMAGKSATRSS